tara:strand:- start:3490 stop:4905 length:1416 start_codon:yes stop_codon:yes gene_type:complete
VANAKASDCGATGGPGPGGGGFTHGNVCAAGDGGETRGETRRGTAKPIERKKPEDLNENEYAEQYRKTQDFDNQRSREKWARAITDEEAEADPDGNVIEIIDKEDSIRNLEKEMLMTFNERSELQADERNLEIDDEVWAIQEYSTDNGSAMANEYARNAADYKDHAMPQMEALENAVDFDEAKDFIGVLRDKEPGTAFTQQEAAYLGDLEDGLYKLEDTSKELQSNELINTDAAYFVADETEDLAFKLYEVRSLMLDAKNRATGYVPGRHDSRQPPSIRDLYKAELTIEEWAKVRSKLSEFTDAWNEPESGDYASVRQAVEELQDNVTYKGQEIFEAVQFAAESGTIRRDGKPVTVYRGIGVDSNDTKDLYDSLMYKDSFTFTGMGSTSYDPVVPRSFYGNASTRIFLKIKAKNGVGISRWSNVPGEAEVLLPKGNVYNVVSRRLVKEKVGKDSKPRERLTLEVELEEQDM